MKKYLITVIAIAVVLVWSLPSMATITGTSHEISADGGPCESCHIPHAAGGDRLWVEDPTQAAPPSNYTGVVAPLCGFCHYTGMGGNQPKAISDTFVYGDNSHGVEMSDTSVPGGQVDGTGGFPYYTGDTDATIECTTCHDVHSDTNRPFLRSDINAICGQCHGSRRYEDGSAIQSASLPGDWVTATRVGVNNPGSHPVGNDIIGDTSGGDSPITIPNIMSVGTSSIRDTWTLGGHLDASSGVNCVTCHAVHGVEYDVDLTTSGLDTGGTDNSTPNANMLVTDQGSGQTDGDGRNIANGNNLYNTLCEACHVGAAPDSSYNASYDSANAYSTFAPNPGNTAWSHPVDSMDAINGWPGLDTTQVGTTRGWPVGSDALHSFTAGDDLNPMIICESCHVPHPAANTGRDPDDTSNNTFAVSDYILRNNVNDICQDCHDNTSVKHHPIGITFNGDGVSGYLANVNAGAGQVLACNSCHISAHNQTSVGVGVATIGLDPAWKPVGNAAGNTYDVDLSKTCMDCHYSAETGTARWSPTLNDGMSTNSLYSPGGEDWTNHGDGSHYIGPLDPRSAYGALSLPDYWTSSNGLGGAIDPQNAVFDAARGGSDGYSRFGGTPAAPVLVCESCHELQPSLTANSHLLLANYDEQANLGFNRDVDLFCTSCHWPDGTHPLTGENVGTGGDGPLSTDFLSLSHLEDPSGTAGPVMGNTTDNQFTCDSCHQPHNAATRSASFILDVPNTGGFLATVGQSTSRAAHASYGTSYTNPYFGKVSGEMVEYAGFCDVCHNYQ